MNPQLEEEARQRQAEEEAAKKQQEEQKKADLDRAKELGQIQKEREAEARKRVSDDVRDWKGEFLMERV